MSSDPRCPSPCGCSIGFGGQPLVHHATLAPRPPTPSRPSWRAAMTSVASHAEPSPTFAARPPDARDQSHQPEPCPVLGIPQPLVAQQQHQRRQPMMLRRGLGLRPRQLIGSSADGVRNSASSRADGDPGRRGYAVRSIHATGLARHHELSPGPRWPAVTAAIACMTAILSLAIYLVAGTSS